MKKVLSIILAVLMLAALGVTVFADSEELTAGVSAGFTVLGSSYDEEDGVCRMIVSNRMFTYQTYDESYSWYYTTLHASYKPDDREVTLSSDGSGIGNAALESFKNKEPVPAGTVVKLTWNGEILESYPPQFSGKIYGFEFTGETTEYSLDEMEQALSDYYLNSDETEKIPSEGVRCAEKADFAVAGCDSSTLKDGEYTKSGSTLYLVQNGASQNFVRLTVDVDKFAVVCGEGDAELTETYKNFIKTGELPVGTVVSISWTGMILDSYPAQLEGVFGLTVTSKESDYSDADLKAKMDAFNEEFEGSSQGDYPAMIFYKGVLYKLSDSALELPQGAEFKPIGTLSYVEGEPTESGTQNYSRQPVEFAEAVYNGVDCLVAYCDGDYRFFLPYTASPSADPAQQSHEEVPVPKQSEAGVKNPETGVGLGNAFALAALAGASVYALTLRASRRRKE